MLYLSKLCYKFRFRMINPYLSLKSTLFQFFWVLLVLTLDRNEKVALPASSAPPQFYLQLKLVQFGLLLFSSSTFCLLCASKSFWKFLPEMFICCRVNFSLPFSTSSWALFYDDLKGILPSRKRGKEQWHYWSN